MSTSYMSRMVQGWGATQSCAYCHGFGKIPTLIRGSDGKMYLNPDAEIVRRFTVRAEPYGLSLAPGASEDFAITVPASEESLGDLLISELMAFFTPDTTRQISVELLSTQTTRAFQNQPIYSSLIFGNAQLNSCLPCCTLVQATNSLLLRVTNNDTVPVEIRIVARGKRFLPKSDELRSRMLHYWNSIPTIPYFLTLDPGQVEVPAGEFVDTTMTVQGTGDFEIKYARCEVLDTAGAALDPTSIITTLTEQVGRELQSDPLPLGAFVATPTLEVAGFPGGLYRAASAHSCPPVSQLLKRNTKLRVRFENTSGSDAIVRLTFAGCFHFVGECPPGRSFDRARSLEPTIGPLLIDQRDYCPPVPESTVPVVAPEPIRGPAPVVAPPGSFQVPVSGGPAGAGGSRSATGPMSYLSKSYEAAPGGGVRAIHGAAHGYTGEFARSRGLQGMQAPPGQPRLPRGSKYWDPYTGSWKVVR